MPNVWYNRSNHNERNTHYINKKKVFKVYNNIIGSQNTQYYGGNSILITAWNIIMVRHLHAKSKQ